MTIDALVEEARVAKVETVLLVGIEDTTADDYPSRKARTPMAFDAFRQIGAEARLQLLFVAGINPYICDDQSLANLETGIRGGWCIGVKVFLGYYPEPLDSLLYRPVFDIAERYRLSILVHTGHLYETGPGSEMTRPVRVREMASRYPGASWIACHMGNPWFDEVAESFADVGNMFADTAGLSMVDMHDASGLRLRHLAHKREFYERLVFGSDWPFFSMQNEADAVERTFPKEALELIFAVTPRSLFRLDKIQ